MLKKIFTVLFLNMIISPVIAGELENAIKDNDYVFLYLYTKNCGFCKRFNSFYEQVTKKHSDKYKFVKIDADTHYGYEVMRHYGAYYVPYVVLLDTKARKGAQIGANCLLSSVCLNHAVDNFSK